MARNTEGNKSKIKREVKFIRQTSCRHAIVMIGDYTASVFMTGFTTKRQAERTLKQLVKYAPEEFRRAIDRYGNDKDKKFMGAYIRIDGRN